MLFIVIPAFNRIKFTLNCLDSLSNQSCELFETILVDDGSSDNTATVVKKKYPEVTILKGDGNLWWSGASNLGVQYALFKGAKYILLLNNDLTLEYNYIENMLKGADDNCIRGSVLLSTPERNVLDGGSYLNYWTANRKEFNLGVNVNDIPSDTSLSVNVLPGRGLLIPSVVFEEIGLFNQEKLPQYGADYEFTIRAHKHGYYLFCDYSCKLFSQENNFNIKSRYSHLSWSDILKSFFSIRSSNSILYKFNFAHLSFGKVHGSVYFCFDLVRTVISHVLRKLNV